MPVIFSILPDKSEETYVRLFKLIRDKLHVTINHYKCDYEIAPMNAIVKVFPNVQVSGCYRHFNIAVWKKSNTLNITNTREGRKITRWCAAIPLVPAEFIAEAWSFISQNMPNTQEMTAFQNYFHKQWFPRYHPSILSCHNQTHRTTNPVEGWNSRFNKKLPKRPGLFWLIQKFRREARRSDRYIKKGLYCMLRQNRRNRDIFFNKKYDKTVKKLLRGKITVKEFLMTIALFQTTLRM